MKKLSLVILLLMGTRLCFAQDNITFADATVKALCVDPETGWDTNGDGELSYAEAAAVRSLGEVFKNNNTITSFSELQYFTGLSSIGSRAFYYCSSLTSVTIPNSVTSIGYDAFYGCSGLTSVTIPNSVTSIGYYAFYGCSGLTSVYYTGDIAQWCGIEFRNDYYNSYSNPCYYAHNLYINNQLVTDLVIPNSVTTISDYAFYGCSCLTSVTIPNSVTSIGYDAFYGCSGLNAVHYTGDIAQWCGIEFSGYSSNPCYYAHNLYINSQLVTDLVIPNSVTTISDYAFSGCSGLNSVTIPNSVTSIGNSAFYGCSGLTSVTIGNSVTTIGGSAFSGCSGLTSVHYTGDIAQWCGIEFGNSLSNPCYYAHNLNINSQLVTDLVIPNSVTTIGDYAFYACNSFTSLTLGNSVTSIGYCAFKKCIRLSSITSNNETPPSLKENSLDYVNPTIPVYVPCGASDAYQNAFGWRVFPNIIAEGTYEYTITLCPGSSFYWHGTEYTESGTYTFETTIDQGCSREEVLHLLFDQEYVQELDIYEVACDTYTWTDGNGQTYVSSGDYVCTTTAQGCDKTVTLHLTINYSEEEAFDITECDSFTWHGITYTTSGYYTYNTTTPEGCERIEPLHLTINHSEDVYFAETACDAFTWHGTEYTASGTYTFETTTPEGCTRTEHLDLTISDIIETEFSKQVCDGYTWNGQTYSTSGDYTQQFTSAQGCDSIVTLHLTISDAIHTEILEQACDEYTWNETSYTYSGDYTQQFTSSQGCDSIVALHLTINHSEDVYFAETACDAFTWHGTEYTASGTYTFETTTPEGCTRTEHLDLTISDIIETEFSKQVCDGYTWNGQTYSTSGDYTQQFTSVQGCDSIVTLHLTISDVIQNDFSMQVCNNYTWNGQTYNTSGDYTQQFTSVQGCDSIVTLHLTISDVETESFTVTECDSYSWHGTTYTESGVYTFETITPEGCQRIETLHLTVNPSETEEFTMTAVESYTWHGTTYTESGDYTYETTTAEGCPRIETLHLTITHGQEFYTIIASAGPNGRIQPEGEVHVESGGLISFTITPDPGCAISQVIIDGVEYAPIETVAFSNVHGDHTLQALFWGVGVEENEMPVVKISPNPARKEALVECEGMRRVELYSLSGVKVFDKETQNDNERMALDGLSSGMYVVKVVLDGGYCQYAKLIVSE